MRTARRKRRGHAVLVRVCAIALASAMAASCAERTPTSRVSFTECRIPRIGGAARCASVAVPLDRAHPERGTTRIAVAVLPASTLDPKPDPLFLLAGGPGQSSAALAPVVSALAGVRNNRDIVLVDPRGAGDSSPLHCDALAPRDALLEVVDAQGAATLAQRCLAELRAGNVDLAQYTTEVYVADLDAVREALGYRTVNLWGGSYGTRVAQHYVRRHPDRVRSVVLDGVAPPSLRIVLDVWPAREEALAASIEACRRSPPCARAYPDPAATLAHLRGALARPRRVALVDPRTGGTRDVALDFDVVIGALEALVYVPELASLIPPIVDRADRGDFAPLFAATMSLSDVLAQTMSLPLHYAVACGEDAPRVSENDARLATENVSARGLVARNLDACNGWPRAELAPDFTTPLVSDKPFLLLSGGLDPVTPPSRAAAVASTLTMSRHIVAAGFGHIVSPHACAPRLIERFIDDAGFARLDRACIDALAASARPPPYASLLSP